MKRNEEKTLEMAFQNFRVPLRQTFRHSDIQTYQGTHPLIESLSQRLKSPKTQNDVQRLKKVQRPKKRPHDRKVVQWPKSDPETKNRSKDQKNVQRPKKCPKYKKMSTRCGHQGCKCKSISFISNISQLMSNFGCLGLFFFSICLSDWPTYLLTVWLLAVILTLPLSTESSHPSDWLTGC